MIYVIFAEKFGIIMRKITSLLIAAACAMTGCAGMSAPEQLAFESIKVDKKVALCSDTNSPVYDMKLDVKYAKGGSEDMRKIVNDAITAKIFNLHNVDLKAAVDSFVNENSHTYINDMLPLYKEDKRDIDKMPMYQHEAIINAVMQR